MPAPTGNISRLTSGLRRSHRYLTAGRLPPRMSYIRRITREFRTALERAVTDAHGEVSMEHAGIVNTAMRFEVAALLAQRWLSEAGDTLSPSDKLAHVKLIAEASASRDKCVKLLKLDTKHGRNPWDYVRNPPPAAGAEPASSTSTEAAA
jgi:hypothetical protein